MRTILSFFLSVLFISNICSQKIDTLCNQSVNFKEYTSLLPKSFCMPQEFTITHIYVEDVNSDGKLDRIIKYSKKRWKCSDTVFIAIYIGENDSTYSYFRFFSNLYTPLVEQSFKDLEWLVKNCKDEYMHKWAWDNQSWVKFEKGQIIVPFALDLWNGYDFYFTYDQTKNNWVLTKKQSWYIPDGEYERKYDNESKPEKVENGISIDEFRIRDYIQPW